MTRARRGPWIRVSGAMAALVLAVACSGSTTDGTASASAPTTSVAPERTELDAQVIGDASHPGYTVEVPDGWSLLRGAFVVKDVPGVLGLSVWDVGSVPAHPCEWRGTETPAGTSVSDLVDLLVAQPLRDATEAVDVTLAGYDGRYLELSVPDDWVVTGDSNFEGCDDPGNGNHDFVSWWGKDAGERYQQVAGQVDRVWILDVDGQRLVVDATYSPDTTTADRAELDQVVASIRFEER